MTPRWGNTILFRSSQQLPRHRLGPLKGFLSWHCALQGPSTRLVCCFRIYRETRKQSGVPRSQDTVKNNWRKPWLCVCYERTCLHGSLMVIGQQNRIELVTRPGWRCESDILQIWQATPRKGRLPLPWVQSFVGPLIFPPGSPDEAGTACWPAQWGQRSFPETLLRWSPLRKLRSGH